MSALASEIKSWVEESPYSAALGAKLDTVEEEGARLLLPFGDANSNPGKVLHGGCAASLAAMGGQVVARATLGADAAPFHVSAIQINYLAAARDEEVVATATRLRRGKDMCFVEVDVATHDGKSIAHSTAMVRGRFGAEAPELYASARDDGATDPGPMGPHVGKMPFTSARGMNVEHMTDGHSRLTLPLSDANADQSGGMHEGAVLALLDTTGAMASWAEVGPGPYKASTPALQAQILCPPPKDDLIAYGRNVQRDGAIYWSDVEVTGATDGRVVARGTVIYRIVT